mmetsp:Transcript_4388/g.8276  ORF Transcript_4388/g.8276 Transcript_4388/m.8276 type:complete len:333 (+) Transcript_4388:562-1560(+)
MVSVILCNSCTWFRMLWSPSSSPPLSFFFMTIIFLITPSRLETLSSWPLSQLCVFLSLPTMAFSCSASRSIFLLSSFSSQRLRLSLGSMLLLSFLHDILLLSSFFCLFLSLSFCSLSMDLASVSNFFSSLTLPLQYAFSSSKPSSSLLSSPSEIWRFMLCCSDSRRSIFSISALSTGLDLGCCCCCCASFSLATLLAACLSRTPTLSFSSLTAASLTLSLVRRVIFSASSLSVSNFILSSALADSSTSFLNLVTWESTYSFSLSAVRLAISSSMRVFLICLSSLLISSSSLDFLLLEFTRSTFSERKEFTDASRSPIFEAKDRDSDSQLLAF